MSEEIKVLNSKDPKRSMWQWYSFGLFGLAGLMERHKESGEIMSEDAKGLILEAIEKLKNIIK